jgi:hypothetical protein
MNERLLREWIRECLLLEQEQEEPESLAPNALEGVDWDEISKGTLFGQMEKLAALSQDRYSSPFFPPSAQGGSFSISSSSKEGAAYIQAYRDSTQDSQGLKAEDGMKAFYSTIGAPITKTTAQSGGADLEIGSDIGELKTSKSKSLNLALNSTAPRNDPSHYYLFMTSRDDDPPTVYVVNSQALYYRNFQALAGINPETGELDNEKLTVNIKKALASSLGGLDLEDIIAQSAMAERPEEVKLSFTLGGLSVRLRLMFTLKGKIPPPDETDISDIEAAVKIESINIIKDKPMLNENQFNLLAPHLIAEELTKTDVEKIAKSAIEKDRAEQKRIIKKEIESELKSSLGTSFFGNPGKVRKAIEEIVQDELSRSFGGGGKMKDQVADITKAVLKKMYREISHSYNPVIDRIRI